MRNARRSDRSSRRPRTDGCVHCDRNTSTLIPARRRPSFLRCAPRIDWCRPFLEGAISMAESSHTIRQEIHGVVLFVGAIWAVFLVSLVFPRLDYFGVIPRELVGLPGIVAMPFHHANLDHLLSNTIPAGLRLYPRCYDPSSPAHAARIVGSRCRHRPAGRCACSGSSAGLPFRYHRHQRLDIARPRPHSWSTFRLPRAPVDPAPRRACSSVLPLRQFPRPVGSFLVSDLKSPGTAISCGAIAGGIVAYAATRGSRRRARVSPDVPSLAD